MRRIRRTLRSAQVLVVAAHGMLSVPPNEKCTRRVSLIRRLIQHFVTYGDRRSLRNPTDEEALVLSQYLAEPTGAHLLLWCCTVPEETLCWGEGINQPALVLRAFGGTEEWVHCCFASHLRRELEIPRPWWVAAEATAQIRSLPSQCHIWHPRAFDDFERTWGHRMCRIQVKNGQLQGCNLDSVHSYKGGTKVVRAEQLSRALVIIQAHTGLPEGLDMFVSLEDAEVVDWPVPVLAPARAPGTRRVALIPPLELMSPSMGQVQQRVEQQAFSIPWEKKSHKIYFRGTLSENWHAVDSNGGLFALPNASAARTCHCSDWMQCLPCVDKAVTKTGQNWHDFPRGRLALLSKAKPHVVDARLSPCLFTGPTRRCSGGCVKPNFTSDLCKILEEAGVTDMPGSPRSSPEDHMNHRYVAILDGSGYPSRLYWAAFGNSVLLVPQSNLLSWLKPSSRIFQPFKHFLPVRADLADITQVWNWAEEHAEESRNMALEAQKTAKEAFDMRGALQYLQELMNLYAERLFTVRARCASTSSAA